MKRKRNRNATFVSRWGGGFVVVASRLKRNELFCSLYPSVLHSSRVSCEVANARGSRGVAEYDTKEPSFRNFFANIVHDSQCVATTASLSYKDTLFTCFAYHSSTASCTTAHPSKQPNLSFLNLAKRPLDLVSCRWLGVRVLGTISVLR